MSDVRKNWTARGNLRFETNIVNDNSWITSLRTVEQLGTPGLEGDVWRVQLENSPDGVSQAAMKVFRADFDMEHLIDLMNGSIAEMDDIYHQIEQSARSFYAEASFRYEHDNILRPYSFGELLIVMLSLCRLLKEITYQIILLKILIYPLTIVQNFVENCA